MNRLQQIQVGGNLLRTFIYDTNTLDSTFPSHGTGRLVAVQYPGFGGGSLPTIQFNEMYSYKISGQVETKRLQVNETPPYPWNTPQTQNLDAAYTYDTEADDYETVHEIIKNLKRPDGKVSYDDLLDAWRSVLCQK